MGYQIRLDFRDKFRMEPSEDCKFDYLEVRMIKLHTHAYDDDEFFRKLKVYAKICKNFDEKCFLQIRDGPHAYSKLIGKFCGNNFPDSIDSSGRHLWLNFKSDDNIEEEGFKAVYEFKARPQSGKMMRRETFFPNVLQFCFESHVLCTLQRFA